MMMVVMMPSDYDAVVMVMMTPADNHPVVMVVVMMILRELDVSSRTRGFIGSGEIVGLQHLDRVWYRAQQFCV